MAVHIEISRCLERAILVDSRTLLERWSGME